MKIPKFYLSHKATLYPYLGQTAVGKKFGAAVNNVHCRIFNKKTLKRTSEGREIVTQPVGIFHPDTTIEPEYKVNYGGRDYVVLEVIPVQDFATVHHLEVLLR